MHVLLVLLIRGFLFLIGCFVTPLTRIRLLARRRYCPAIRSKILVSSASKLARDIRNGQVTSEEVVAVYVERCKQVNPLLNAIVEERFEAALEEAREVDRTLKGTSRRKEEIARDTPLLGVPVTVKESIAVRGLSQNIGRKLEVPIVAAEDADVVRRVREAGGIVLLVSNTPEMCMCWESYNNVTGTTYNPYDTRRTAGGSSGGEAALLGSGASVLSLSSDIGGSARLPAMFCGVFGHKPSPKRISTVGHMPDCHDEKWSSFFTICPMVRYAADLPLFLNVISQTDEPVDEQVDLRKMRFFYMENDHGSGFTHSIDRDMKRAIRRLRTHIETRFGVPVKDGNLEGMRHAFEVSAIMLLTLNGVDTIFSKSSDPDDWKSVTLECLKYVSCRSPHTFPNIAYGVVKKTADKFPAWYNKRIAERNVSLKKSIQDLLGDDGVLIYPTFTTSAHCPYEIFPKICNVSYMMIFNSLGLPVTQCPMGFDRHGLPIGLQIVANPGKDSLTIAVAREIEEAFGGWREPPTLENH